MMRHALSPIRWITLLALGVSAIGCAPAAPARKPGDYHETLQIEGRTRSYIVKVPPQYTGQALPLVVVLHGWTATGALAEIYTGMGAKAEKEGFVAVFPDGLGAKDYLGWNVDFINLTGQVTDDVKFVDQLIDQVEAEVKIDKRRVYVCGHSNGAMLSHLVGAKLGNKLAAIGVVAGTIGLDTQTPAKLISDPRDAMSVMILHGKQDAMVGYNHDAKALLIGVSALDSALWWVRADLCAGKATHTTLAPGITEDLWSGGKQKTEVALVSFENGTHDWPGGMTREGPETVSGGNAADLLWEFFRTHPRR
jgi:polyhydroxybutyrate depolymerase